MEKPLKRTKRNVSRAGRKLRCRLSGFVKTAILGGVCIWGLLNTGKLNLAYAVDNGSDIIAYVSSPQELDAVVGDVQRVVSSALGCSWDAPELNASVRLGMPGDVECDADAVVDWLYGTVSNVQTLELVYVDGKAVCAFETAAEASDALKALINKHLTDNVESAAFAETISVASGKADLAMLEGNLAALEAAVTVVTTRYVTVEETLPYETKLVVNNSMYEDQSYIDTYGRDGLAVREYLVTSRDSQVADYRETACTRYEPVAQVVVIGGKVRLSTGTYIWPVSAAYISSDYGWRSTEVGSTNHQGIDLAYDYGTPILAADGGVVTFSGVKGGYGELVTIEHDNGDVTYYAHCSKLLVSEGDIVKQGDQIALMGSSGTSTGSHLHFEIHPGGGRAVNPTSMLPKGSFQRIDC